MLCFILMDYWMAEIYSVLWFEKLSHIPCGKRIWLTMVFHQEVKHSMYCNVSSINILIDYIVLYFDIVQKENYCLLSLPQCVMHTGGWIALVYIQMKYRLNRGQGVLMFPEDFLNLCVHVTKWYSNSCCMPCQGMRLRFSLSPCVLFSNYGAAFLVIFDLGKGMSRQEQFQENINKRVLLDWVRIVGLENPHRKTYDKVLTDFAHNIIKYPADKPLPFSWPTGAGVYKGIPAIRARISYDCWRFFLSEGRNHLSAYNTTNKKDIRIIKEQTIKVSDEEKLGLYIRKFIRDVHAACRRKCPDVVLKKGILHIGKEFSFTPAMTAYRFNINLQNWHGLPLEEMFTAEEKEAIAKGEIEKGSLRLTGVNLTKPVVSNEEDDQGPERKRPRTEETDVSNQAGPSTSTDS